MELENSKFSKLYEILKNENEYDAIIAYDFISLLCNEVKNCLSEIGYYSENKLMYPDSSVFTEVLNTANKLNSFILLRLENSIHCYKEFNLIKIKDEIYISLEGFLKYDTDMNKLTYPKELFEIVFFGFDITIYFEGKSFISLNMCDFIRKEFLRQNDNKLKLETKSIEKRKTYLMIDENTGFYKIGYSKNVEYREKTLQSEKPVIKLLFYCDNFIETELHKKYKSKRIRGEYFNLSADDIIDIYEIFKVNGIHMGNYSGK